MKVAHTQLVIFGDFSSIGFTKIELLTDLITKYGFKVYQQPDNLSHLDSINQNVQLDLIPVLKNRSLSIYLGKRRIQVENITDIDFSNQTYDDVYLNIIKTIVNAFSLKVNRIGLNGLIVEENESLFETIYLLFCTKNTFFDKSTDDWTFSNNNRYHSSELNHDLNALLRINYGSNIFDSKKAILINYDINTVVDSNTIYGASEIDVFYSLAIKYRNKVMNISE